MRVDPKMIFSMLISSVDMHDLFRHVWMAGHCDISQSTVLWARYRVGWVTEENPRARARARKKILLNWCTL